MNDDRHVKAEVINKNVVINLELDLQTAAVLAAVVTFAADWDDIPELDWIYDQLTEIPLLMEYGSNDLDRRIQAACKEYAGGE